MFERLFNFVSECFVLIETNENLSVLNLASREDMEKLPILIILFLLKVCFVEYTHALSFWLITPFLFNKAGHMLDLPYQVAVNKCLQWWPFHVHNDWHLSYFSRNKTKTSVDRVLFYHFAITTILFSADVQNLFFIT